jgi:hypothetical protein
MDKNHPRVITPLPIELLVAIDDFRFATRQPSRVAAIRALLEQALHALGHWPPPAAAAKESRTKR